MFTIALLARSEVLLCLLTSGAHLGRIVFVI
jgi:hypothetical protein